MISFSFISSSELLSMRDSILSLLPPELVCQISTSLGSVSIANLIKSNLLGPVPQLHKIYTLQLEYEFFHLGTRLAREKKLAMALFADYFSDYLDDYLGLRSIIGNFTWPALGKPLAYQGKQEYIKKVIDSHILEDKTKKRDWRVFPATKREKARARNNHVKPKNPPKSGGRIKLHR